MLYDFTLHSISNMSVLTPKSTTALPISLQPPFYFDCSLKTMEKKKMMFAKFVAILEAFYLMLLSEAGNNTSTLLGPDEEALHSIRESFFYYNPNSTILQDWNKQPYSGCSWTGIECTSDGKLVMGLKLSGAKLTGPLPQALGNLTGLSYLRLASNNFSGNIPHSFRNLVQNSLEILELSSNNLGGEIPPLLFDGCSKLVVLNLSGNGLTGSVPGFEKCKKLRELSLSWNNFTGEIPGGLLNKCGALTELDLEYNNLSGSIPGIHVRCSSLTVLRLSKNLLTGQLPKELATLSKLKTLALGKNEFTGPIPPEIGRLAELRTLLLDNNQLNGTIPATIGHLVKLNSLFMHRNKIKGSIPPEIGSLRRIQVLDLNNNELTGAIPAELGTARSLRLLFVSSNSLDGPIPPAIGNLTKLQGLDLSENRLTGNIPSNIRNLQSLLWLSLSYNHLEGHLPPEIVECGSLVWLNLANNRLSGEIPGNIGLLGQRADVTFARNRVSPSVIPDAVGECWAMSKWIPWENPFIFDIFKRIRCYEFWSLIFRGQMKYPICINNPHTLHIPAYIQLSGNRFTGTIPASLGSYTRLGALFLGDNLLTGNIPVEISNLTGLWQLNVSKNNLSGTIPQELDGLRCLTTLDLSYNSLQGIIPPSLAKLTSLTKFNVSYNEKLWGPVPTDGQFLGFLQDSYIGDSCLVTSSANRSNLKNRCSENSTDLGSPKSGKAWTVEIICISAAAVAIVATCCISASLLLRKSSSRRKGPTPVEEEPSSSVSFVACGTLNYDAIVKATDNFSDSRCIGKGGQGVVYRAELDSGLLVAIKRLCHEDPMADVEFLAEIQTVGQLSHPNLVPLIGCCIRGNERILVFKLIENGSLEDWLNQPPPAVLCWPRRLKIALQSAVAVRFLHHECQSVIIHRDIKASNILLDEDFGAFVTDFGLARNQSNEKTHVTTIVAGTLGYVPPEYGYSLQATTKGDVYSFGVVLFQLATGMKATGMDDELEGGLVAWVREKVASGKMQEIFDPRVVRSEMWNEESAIELVRVAWSCTLDNPQLRPSMIEVALKLKEINNHGFVHDLNFV